MLLPAFQLANAADWAIRVPKEEDRAVEFMIRKLHEMIQDFPDSSNPVVQTAWDMLKQALLAQAAELYKNGLPRS